MERIVRFIESERQRQHLGQNELADRAGIAKSTLSRILAEGSLPSLETLQGIAKGLGYDFLSFLALASGTMTDFQRSEMAVVWARLSPKQQAFLLDTARRLLEE
jgi:transcriptional regulator with XRE-family HTH domain